MRAANPSSSQGNGKSPRTISEMERSDPQFKAALKAFGEATRFFYKQKYGKARELFEKVASSPARDLAERARVHLAVCEQKLGRPAPAPKNAGDYYDLAIAKLNARETEQAIELLNKADKSNPNSEHIKYALAAAHAIQGNAEAALEQLKTAIELRPGNRFQARLDEDFQPLFSDPRFKRLMSAAAN